MSGSIPTLRMAGGRPARAVTYWSWRRFSRTKKGRPGRLAVKDPSIRQIPYLFRSIQLV